MDTFNQVSSICQQLEEIIFQDKLRNFAELGSRLNKPLNIHVQNILVCFYDFNNATKVLIIALVLERDVVMKTFTGKTKSFLNKLFPNQRYLFWNSHIV